MPNTLPRSAPKARWGELLLRRENEDGINRVSVHLAGDEYVIRGEDAPDHLAQVAESVEAKLQEAQDANPKLAKTQLAMLVALTLADELCKLRREHEDVLRLLREAK